MSQKSYSTDASMFILAGQSNMDGEGYVDDLPPHLKRVFENAWIYNPNRRDDQQPIENKGFWEKLKPGHGSGYRTDGSRSYYSNRFGPELSFASRVLEKSPEHKILIYKYAKGGSSIHSDAATDWGCWHPEYTRGNQINQWTHFQHHLQRARETAERKFGRIVPAGIAWHQGESDASHTRSIADSYGENLSVLLNKMREQLNNRSLPIAVGQISDSMMGRGKRKQTYPFGDILKSAQRLFVEQDKHAALVTAPENHGFIDAWHYDSQTYIELGYRFAEALMDLRQADWQTAPS
ncbi:sialate O-acetylesterase [Rhodohalobacter sp. 8-1]|uniref:sialate O-acetylesterase n=1 Tax=Rhodohalobacter sp. 8-1 TaxID=3131972 RepID=UPI0030EF5BAA